MPQVGQQPGRAVLEPNLSSRQAAPGAEGPTQSPGARAPVAPREEWAAQGALASPASLHRPSLTLPRRGPHSLPPPDPDPGEDVRESCRRGAGTGAPKPQQSPSSPPPWGGSGPHIPAPRKPPLGEPRPEVRRRPPGAAGAGADAAAAAGSGRSPSHRKPASPQMKSEQRWQKVGLVSITFRKVWPSAAGPGDLALARSGPDPGPAPGSGSGRARPPLPRSGLEAGLSGRGEPPPSQARAPDSAAAAIPDPGGPGPGGGRAPEPRFEPDRPWSQRCPRGLVRRASDCARRHCAGAHSQARASPAAGRGRMRGREGCGWGRGRDTGRGPRELSWGRG